MTLRISATLSSGESIAFGASAPLPQAGIVHQQIKRPPGQPSGQCCDRAPFRHIERLQFDRARFLAGDRLQISGLLRLAAARDHLPPVG